MEVPLILSLFTAVALTLVVPAIRQPIAATFFAAATNVR